MFDIVLSGQTISRRACQLRMNRGTSNMNKITTHIWLSSVSSLYSCFERNDMFANRSIFAFLKLSSAEEKLASILSLRASMASLVDTMKDPIPTKIPNVPRSAIIVVRWSICLLLEGYFFPLSTRRIQGIY